MRCKCGKDVRLDKKWDPDLFERHNKGGGCKYNNGLLGITNFFKENDSKTNKRKIYEGLTDEETRNYLKCIGLITSFGGAPHVELVAKETFPRKFNKKFTWNCLNKSEKDILNNALHEKALWINDSNTFCVRSNDCSKYIDNCLKKITCKPCLDLKKNHEFQNALAKKIPNDQNRKFIPKILYQNNSLFKYCNNTNILTLWSYLNKPEDNTKNFWNIWLLWETMISTRISEGKSLQNIKYPSQFTIFLAILSSTSPQAYHLFQENLAERLLRTNSDLSLNDPRICHENMRNFKQFLDDDDIRSISDNMVLVNNHFVGNNLSEDILLKDIEITNNDGHVNFSALIEYCTQNKAYTSKNILVSQVVNNLNSNDNQPKSCLIRWGIRKRLDNINQITQDIGLKQLNLNSSESPSIPAITIANISSIYPAIKGGFAFALINSKIHLVQFLALYYHSTTGNYHSYAKEPITDVDIISNVSCKSSFN
ncbi:9193_t:CDS:2 [Entrophospora sp. SA101]|nr:9193_t:CDS:2 [Entrophospora sp. SA101]